jgi:hypothetical protein
MKTKIEVVKKKYGFYEIKEKPNKDYLINYYAKKYFQNNKVITKSNIHKKKKYFSKTI